MDEIGRRKGSATKKKKTYSVKKKHSVEDGSNSSTTSDTDDSETEDVTGEITNDRNKQTSPKFKIDDKDSVKLKCFESFKERRDRIAPQENVNNNDLTFIRNKFKDQKNLTRSINTSNKGSVSSIYDIDKRNDSLEKEISTFKYADGSEVKIYTSDGKLDNIGKLNFESENNIAESHGARVIATMDRDSLGCVEDRTYFSENNFVVSDTNCCNSNNSCTTANTANFLYKFHKRSGSDILSQISKFNQPHLQDCVSAPSLNSKDASLQGLSPRGQIKRAKITRFYSQNYQQNRGELRVVEPLISQDSTKSSLAAVWGAKQESIKKINRKSNLTRKLSSWEERTNVERRRSLAGRGTVPAHLTSSPPAPENTCSGPVVISHLTLPSYLDSKDLRYCFQHPYLRLITTSFVIFCNFLMFAEDPISHSQAESFIPVVGNVFSFIFTKYSPDWRWALVKVLMWILAILCGLVFGKIFIHDIIFGKYMRLKMFRDEQGSWILMFLTVILSLYLFSHVYNIILFIFYNKPAYSIDSSMGLSNSTVMKAAVCGTWLGDLVTLLMVLDVMLQDSLYPSWAPNLRMFCRKSNIPRVVLFWVGSALATGLVVALVVTESLSWDALNRDLLPSTELTRAFLASFILVLDLMIMMQDWDFPHFTTTVHINLPGFSVARLQWKYAEVNLTGKWFSYGVIFMVMLLDLNMWQNQIFYRPQKFGQYIGPDNKIRTVLDLEQIRSGNSSLDWESRSKINPNTQQPYFLDDLVMNSRYMGYPMILKCTAFLPSIITLSIYLCLIYLYGRFPQIKQEKVTLSAEGSEPQASETESEDGGISV